jgi:iron complex outermembrane recepter protein
MLFSSNLHLLKFPKVNLLHSISVYTFFALFFSAYVSGQSVNIRVKDGQNQTLIGATVHITNADDSSRVSTITNQNGVAAFQTVRPGLYVVNVSYIGFRPLEKSVRIRDGQNNFEYELEDDVVSLGEVTVTARRPLIRQEDDKMIIDPEPLASISTNTLEILESTPGLFVDQDGGIFLSSATPATVYINGREQKMSSQDINTILRSLPPHSVQHIEVIRTPSARYAASSSGGIINIVLKKGVKIGRFGSVTSGMNQGFYGNQFAGVTFNNSGSRTTSYVNMNYNSNNMLEQLNSTRFLNEEMTITQTARTRRHSNQLFLGYGVNMDANEKINLAYDGRINGSLPGSSSNNTNFINFNEALLGQTNNLVDNSSRFLNIQQDFGVNYKLDTLGSELDTKFSYAFIANNTLQDYRNMGVFPANTLEAGDGDNVQRRHYVQFQSDLSYRLPFEIKLEAGINSSYQDYGSDAAFFVWKNNQQEADTDRTNAFNYQENINAGYLQFSRDLGWKVLLKTGMRMEHTLMNGNQTIPSDTSFVVDRVDWFPYVYLSRPLVNIAGAELRGFLIYRKTITRPGYQSLNPALNYVDEFLYETGNPGLKPQFAENIEANISFNDFPIFAVGRSYTRDIFSGVVYQDPRNPAIALRTFDNLGKSKETYFRAMAGIPPGGRYFFAVGSQYNLNEYDGFYENQPLLYNHGSWRFFTFHMLRIDSQTRLTLNGFMMTNGWWNFYELKTFGQLNLGLNRTFLNKRLTVTLSARDVLRTMVNDFELNQGSISTFGNRYTDNQRFGINLRYTFGIPNRQERQQNMFQFENGSDGP